MDYWFIFKKTASLYLNPLTISLEMVILGLVLIGFARRRSKKKRGRKWLRFKRWTGDAGVLMIVLGALFLYLCSIDPIANSAIFTLEKKYPGLPEDAEGKVDIGDFQPEYIVVLAGGSKTAEGKPVFSSLSSDSFARVSGAVLLWKQFPDSQMIFTGRPQETETMAKTAILMGVDKGKTLQERESRDTKDHPVFIKPMVKDRPFFLVTSGYHMPRAMGLFQNQGLTPMPAPNDFRVWPVFEEYNPYKPEKLFPRVNNLLKTDKALHEFLGMAWADLRNQVPESPEEPRESTPKPRELPGKKPPGTEDDPPRETPEEEESDPRGTLATLPEP